MHPWAGCLAYAAIAGCAVFWRINEAEHIATQHITDIGKANAAIAASASGVNNGTSADVETSTFPSPAKQDHAHIVLGLLLESQLSLFILFNFMCAIYVIAALAVKGIFFGKLSVLEAHKLTERSIKYISFKVVFVGAYVTHDAMTVTAWFVWFALLGFVKMFVGLCKDRFECLMSAPSATVLAHARTFGLLVLLFSGTVWWSWVFSSRLWTGATSELLLLMFECVLIVIDAAQTLLRYSIHLLDSWRQARMNSLRSSAEVDEAAQAPWEWQGTILYYSELTSDVLSLGITLLHYCHIWYLHGFAFQLIDGILFLNIRSAALSLRKRFNSFRRYLAATHNVCTIFPDAKPGDLADNDYDCAICREPMSAAKQLPCGHRFHLQCLRAWLQQSGSDNFTCPICRAPLFLKPCEDGSTSDPARLGDVQPGITAARRLVQALIALAPAVPSSDVDLELQGMDLPWPVDAPNIMVLGLDEFGGRHGVGGDGLGSDMLGSTSMETSMDTSSGNSWDGLLSSDNDAEVSIDRSASRQSVEEAGRPIYHRSAGASGMQGLSESLRSISLSIGASASSMSSRRNVIAKDEQEEPGEEAQSKAAASSSKTGDLLHASRVEGPRRRSARLASKAMLERSP